VKKFFSDAGVPFPTGASVTYQDRINTLFVTNTAENLEIFEQVLASLNIVPSQVTIEAKFVEIKQTDLREMGFDWVLGDFRFGSWSGVNNRLNVEGGDSSAFSGYSTRSNPWGNVPVYGTDSGDPSNTTSPYTDRVTQGNRFAGDQNVLTGNAIDRLLVGGPATSSAVADRVVALSGLLTDPQFQVVMRALSQRQNTDLLCAPKVTTISGQQAKVEVVREFIYPTEFEPPRVASSSGGGTSSINVPVISPPTPGGFQTRNLGVTLNVTPQVGPDGYTINLTLIPEVSDFDGFIDYGSRRGLSDPTATGTATAGQIGLAFPFPQPVFSARRVTTSVIIWDNQTVVLGGLIREDAMRIKDKVPILGDVPLLGKLFRNELENNIKRHLLVFVTARLIDPAGDPIHKQAATATGAAAVAPPAAKPPAAPAP
jgi:general secretion pathway protein D